MNLNRYFSSNSSIAFWHLPVYYELNYSLDNPYFYPINFSSKLQYKSNFDKNGIPLLDYKGYIGLRYNACAVAQYALGHLAVYGIKPDKSIHDRIINLANWLANNLQESNEYTGLYSWYYDFDLDAYNIKKPWNSAIAQGQGISVLVRAYRLFGKEEYKEAALKAFSPFVRSVHEGGIQRIIDSEYICFEEVPTRDRVSCVLDGFIYALMGLKDLSVFLNVQQAEILWGAGIKCLRYILPQFDAGYWSKGDMYLKDKSMLASRFYHKLHVAQLRHLSDISGDMMFEEYSRRWNLYSQNNLNVLRAYINKIWFKLANY